MVFVIFLSFYISYQSLVLLKLFLLVCLCIVMVY